MIDTAFAPEPLPAIESLRAAIETTQTSHLRRIAYRCYVFYQEALIELRTRSFDDTNIFRACMEALISASACILECDAISSDLECSKTFGTIAAYGFIQALTQIIEAASGIETFLATRIGTIFDETKAMKQREYWKFRNGHTHIVKNFRFNRKPKSKRAPYDPDPIIPYLFRLGRTSVGQIQYMKLESSNFVICSTSAHQIAEELQSDLYIFFDVALTAMRSHPEK